MKITFDYIRFTAFKGGKPVEMPFMPGGINTIVGANGSGKSTILDALIWCLFGKDFTDRKKFDLIPLNPDGSIQQVSPSVTLDISVDGEDIKLTRRMEGSKTTCEINEAPCQTLKVFDDYIAKLFGTEERFKMFTMPLFFTEALHWTKQRELLMQFFPQPDQAAVFDRMTAEKIRYSKNLVAVMASMQPADYIAKHDKLQKDAEISKTRISAQIKLLDDQLEGNQAIDQATLEAERDQLRLQIAKLNNTIAAVTGDNRTILITKQQLQDSIDAAQRETSRIINDARYARETELVRLKGDLTYKRTQKTSLVRDYQEKSKQVDETCPICGQHLPAATIANVRAKQAETLRKIGEQGAAMKIDIDDLEAKIKDLEGQATHVSAQDTFRLQELSQQINTAQDRLLALPAVKEVPQLDLAVQGRLADIDRALARIDVHRENIKRKADLESQERQLNQEYEQHQTAISEASKYAFYRSTLVIEAVNQHFKTISVKVLDVQKNGTAKETFEITSNGVPYSGLNKTGKLAASLELMEFLKSALHVESPVIIDDIENYPDLDLSTISGQLIVAYAKKRYPLQVVSKYPQDI